MKVRGDVGVRHVMHIHARILIRLAPDDPDTAGRVSSLDFAVPPAIAERTDAATLATALHRRCEALLRARGVPTVLIINTDKASSCVSLACHEAATFATKEHCMSMYGNCQMHMIFASLGAAVSPLKQVALMFCATNLIHRTNNMKLARKLVREIVGELVDVRHPAGFALPSPTQLTHTRPTAMPAGKS